LAILGALVPCEQVHANPMTAQFSITAWGHKDGLSSTFIYAVAQTDDGFLWLGTADGLTRFDGVEFTPWRSIQPNEAPLGKVVALCASRRGGLWLGTGAGIIGRMHDHRLHAVSLHSAIQSIEESLDGSLWVATYGALWHLDGSSLMAVQSPIPLSSDWLSGPLEGKDGTQWITTTQGLFQVKAQNKPKLVSGHLSWLFRAQNGRPALLDELGFIRSLENEKTNWGSSGPLPDRSMVSGVTAESDGDVWIALRGNGVVRLAAADGRTSVERFTRKDGLSSDLVRFVFEDREHDLWIATEKGLDRLQRNNVFSLTRSEGLLSDSVTSIAAGDDGSVWLGTPEGLERTGGGRHAVYLRGTRILSLLTRAGRQLWAGTTRGLMQWKDGHMLLLRHDAKFIAVTAIAEDAAGMLWFYDADKGLFRQQPGHHPKAVTDGSLAHRRVTAIHRGRDREVWFGLDNGDLLAYREGAFHAYSTRDGLSGGEVHGLSDGTDGELWIATDLGLCFSSGNHFDCRDARTVLPGDRVLWAIPDAKGNIWLGYNIGVARIDLRELGGVKASGTEKLCWKLYDVRDGIENSPDLKGSTPAALGHDGRLWLTTSQGVAVLDLAHLSTNPLPPPVHILKLDADGQEIDLSQRIRLRPLTRSIQFLYTGLSLSDPQYVHFRYRLYGFDRDWRDGGLRRNADYTNLSPGRYVFRVSAENSDGVWNDTGATLDFTLAPAYFQTIWFRLLCVSAAFAFAAILFKVRLRSAQRNMRLRYEERVEERGRIARELHDHLIQEMVGIGMQLEVADTLTPGDAGAKRPLQRAVTLSRSAIASGRLALQTLRSRPITGSALVEALKRTAEAYVETNPGPVRYLLEGEERPLHPEIAENVSEIGQEALRNALKHASGSAIVVHLHFGAASLDLSVRDEGGGMDDEVLRTGISGHYGLAGMRERAARITAEFSIRSSPGRGTTVHVSVPAICAYQNDSRAHARDRWSLWRRFRCRSRQEKVK
jgi:signal transduction histidine kinase/ligand-binding sensor domain-containing protein